MNRKQIAIFGGGTISWVASHVALVAPAYGETARRLEHICRVECPEFDRKLYLTKMAGGPSMETNDDVAAAVDQIIRDDVTKIIFFSTAMIDFHGELEGSHFDRGKYGNRLHSLD